MANKHIHRLKKHKYANGTKVFFCTLPDCYFKVEAALALGKESLCNICGEPFIINEKSIKLKVPHCNSCGRKEIKDVNGKKRYVDKRKSEGQVLEQIASNDADELRSRLSNLIADPTEGDI